MNDDLAKQRRTSELKDAQHKRLAAIGRVTAGVSVDSEVGRGTTFAVYVPELDEPDARVLLMSGYGGTQDLSTPPTELTAVLQKPFTLETLLSKVSRALASEVTSGT